MSESLWDLHTKKFNETMANVCIELTLRGINYEVSNHCNFELWIKDKYVIQVYADGRVSVFDGEAQASYDSRPVNLFWGTWMDLFNHGILVNKFYGRKFEEVERW